ncbi:hypothetical protein ECE50_030700 [Chitinophaga sp. Mgbs1]|uniref:Aromatic amino acid beta-eliminating lyase/threonine aldolase domain-containing protein n=1 Tax=Chitinophaga solisilvae TaxID=1233460 RepID=A0A3S1DKG5_9BACT|nr:hypothetical protein [Chitinophaga solisilvae]
MERRTFIKSSGLGSLPFLTPLLPLMGAAVSHPAAAPAVNFVAAGELLNTQQYAEKLQQIGQTTPIEQDAFGNGGCVTALEEKFEQLTGKEKAIFMPTGTMANQLAMKVLSGQQTKVLVMENSHYYRDEADAASTLHNKRLIPLGKENYRFPLDELKAAIEYYKEGEYFPSGVGAMTVEIPVRRNDNRMMSYREFEQISEYCRAQQIPLHLDGARIFMASAWSGIPVSAYAALADTIYISLYKYLGAASGAMLCGKKEVISQMPRLIKIHGGSMYRNWTNAAMVLHGIDGFMDRLAKARQQGDALIAMLNRLPQFRITPAKDGTCVYPMELKGVDATVFKKGMAAQGIRAVASELIINETILYRDNNDLFNAFKKAAGIA